MIKLITKQHKTIKKNYKLYEEKKNEGQNTNIK